MQRYKFNIQFHCIWGRKITNSVFVCIVIMFFNREKRELCYPLYIKNLLNYDILRNNSHMMPSRTIAAECPVCGIDVERIWVWSRFSRPSAKTFPRRQRQRLSSPVPNHVQTSVSAFFDNESRKRMVLKHERGTNEVRIHRYNIWLERIQEDFLSTSFFLDFCP